jgi:Protein of unknown function (DUF4236)/DnaJ domain
MSFGFRKSFGAGPFRFTVSPSGVSSSVGVRGARVTTGPRGTYITVSSHGFYYRERIGGPSRPEQPSSHIGQQSKSGDGTIPTAEVSDLVDSSSEALLEDLNRRAQAMNPASVVAVITVVAIVGMMAVTGSALLLLGGGLVGLMAALIVSSHHRQSIKTQLTYELDQDAAQKFRHLVNAVDALRKSQKLWRVESRETTSDWKRNAGACLLNDRKPITAGQSAPPNLESNLPTPMIDLGNIRLFFFPDRLLVLDGNRFGSVSYDDVEAQASSTRFIETEGVGGDSQVVGQTWRYTNKNGGPDRRFSNNYSIPVALYGELVLRSRTGLNLVLQTSRAEAAHEFQDLFAQLRKSSCGSHAHTRSKGDSHSESNQKSSAREADDPSRRACTLLEVPATATRDEITAAYHRLAAMYHPDKVAHLAPEFQKMADEHMKEFNWAYKLLKSKVS